MSDDRTKPPKPAKGRLSRWKAEVGRVKAVLHPGDDALFRALRDFPYLTREELAAVTGRSTATLGRRLTKLVHAGYVGRKYWLSRPVGHGSPPALYTLTGESAARIAVDEADLKRLRQESRRRDKAGDRHFDHIHAISYFLANVRLAFQQEQGRGQLEDLRIEQDDRAYVVRVNVGGRPVPIWPDASFSVEVEEGAYTYLVEVERAGAERRRDRIEQRFQAYWNYVKVDKPLLERTRGIAGAFVLFVLPNATLRERHRRIATETPGIDRNARTFLFLNFEELDLARPGRLLTEQLCRTMRDDPFELVPQD